MRVAPESWPEGCWQTLTRLVLHGVVYHMERLTALFIAVVEACLARVGTV